MAHPIDKEQEDVSFFDRGIGAVAKKTGQTTMWTLGKYGEGLDWTNEQVKLRNTPLGTLANVTGLDKNKYVSGALDYSYKDVRDDVSEGAGTLTEQALKAVGRSDATAEAWGKGVEVAGQILIPDAVDYIGGVGYLDNLARAGDKLIDSAEGLGKGLSKVNVPNPLSPKLAMAGGPNIKTNQLDDFTPSNVFAYSDIKQAPANVRARKAAQKHISSTKFVDELSQKTKILEDTFAKQGNLEGMTEFRKIQAPNGEKYIYKDTSPKGQKGKYSWKAKSNIDEVIRRRNLATKLDKETIVPLFKKHFSDLPSGDKLAEKGYRSYLKTNQKVFIAVQEAIKSANKLPNGKVKPYADRLSLEHIFDVNFHTRVKQDLVSGFSGKGANELDNIKVIPYLLNSETGALAKKISIDDALVAAVRRGEFTDYDKSIAQFIYADLGTEVENFTKADWKRFSKRVIKGEDNMTVQDILFNMVRTKQRLQAAQEGLGRITHAQVAVGSNGFAAQ